MPRRGPGAASRWLCIALAICVSLLAHARGARAQEKTFANNDYAIDLFTGPVLGPNRIVGMAGAYTAIATGIDGAVFNPAGYAERREKEIDWWEWELTGGISFGSFLRKNDVDNNGRNDWDSSDSYSLSLGGRLQFGHFGFGLTGVGQLYTLNDQNGKPFADTLLSNVRLGFGYALFSGGLVLGGTVRVVMLDISEHGADTSLVSFSGLGGEVGALIRPAKQRYRIGATVRTPIDSRPLTEAFLETRPDGVKMASGLVLPSRVHVPWEVNVGFAYQFWERRSNVPWRHTNGLRSDLSRQIADGTYQAPDTYGGEPYPPLPSDPEGALAQAIKNDRTAERRFLRNQPRRYVLLSAEAMVYGKTEKGQGVVAFLRQVPERSGAKLSFGGRVGVESEVWQNRMKLRGGTYLEPARYARSTYRPHGTMGLDIRMFDLWRWSFRATGMVDLAPRYFNWGVSLGLWH